jgi:hypothetical protein
MPGSAIDLIRFDDSPDFEVSWAGPQPFSTGFVFGSEDGRILGTDESATILVPPIAGSESGEAINGLAVCGDNLPDKGWFAVSTRTDWCMWRVTAGDKPNKASVNSGTHGIISTPSGCFVGAQGLRGLMIVNPSTGEKHNLAIIGPNASSVYFYKVAVLQDEQGSEVFACAARHMGVATAPFQPKGDERDLQTLGYKGWDVVDICPIAPNSLAAAAIGKDRTIRLFKNVLTDYAPLRVRFPSVLGVAYRLLSCRGHLLVLTSKALYVFFEVAGRFIRGELNQGEPILTTSILMEAVDANLYREKYLLVIKADNSVMRIDLAALESAMSQHPQNNLNQQFVGQKDYPNWDSSEILDSTRSVMAGHA